MTLKIIISIIWVLFLCVAVSAQEQRDNESPDDRPIQITVEPAPTPNVTVEAPLAPNVTIQQSKETIWWRILDPAITLLGIVIAARMIIWQMGRQHRSSLELQKESARAEMHAGIYRELQEKISKASSAEVAASGYARMIPFELENYRNQVQMGIQNIVGRPIVRRRATEFMNLNSAMSDGIINLISSFENYAIAAPEFGVFQDALNSAMHDAQTAFNKLHSALLPLLPMDMQDHLPEDLCDAPNANYVPPPPNDEQLEDIQRLVDAYVSAADDIGCYLHDLRGESQNTLLKDLYPGRQVPLREPLDPRLKVITSTNAEELQRFFREETPWGRSNREAEERVRAQLAEREQEN